MPVSSSPAPKYTVNGGGEKHVHRSVYLLPNLLTTAAMFCGFYAIVAAGSTGRFVNASIAIFIAMVLDGLDGRVARLTKTQSEFGKQYDSISDMVCFGVAPALIIYEWSLSGLVVYGPIMGKISWLAAFVYAVCAALRLARFNILPPSEAKEHFLGLASPAAAALIMGGIWFGQEINVLPRTPWVMFVSLFATLAAALLMVSNFRFYSFKQVERVNQVSFLTIVLLIFIFTAIWVAPAYVLFGLAAFYAVSGPVFSKRCGRARRDQSVKESNALGERHDGDDGCDCGCGCGCADESEDDCECDDQCEGEFECECEDEAQNESDVCCRETCDEAESKV